MPEPAAVPAPFSPISQSFSPPDEFLDPSFHFWLLWQAEWNTEKQKYLKMPVPSKSWQRQRQPWSALTPPQELTPKQGYGIIYCAEHPYVCIDVDDGRDGNASLVDALQSYTEWSPSGNGAHVIVSTPQKEDLIAAFGTTAHDNVEKRDLYISSGFVTLTGDRLPAYAALPIKEIPTDKLINILQTYFGARRVLSHPSLVQPKLTPLTPSVSQPLSNVSDLVVYRALESLPVQYLPSNAFTDFPFIDTESPNAATPESREAWLTVGMALHHQYRGAVAGFTLWQNWSQQGQKYDAHGMFACWESFGQLQLDNPVTFASVLKLLSAQCPQYVDFTGKLHLPMPTLENIKIFLDFTRIKTRYNVHNNLIEVSVHPKLKQLFSNIKDEYMPSESAIPNLVSELRKQHINDRTVRSLIECCLSIQAADNIYNRVVEYFTEQLPAWDGHTRIPQLMSTITLAEDADAAKRAQYTMYVRKWLVQVIAAVFTTMENPHTLDHVLILQGAQGIGKTRWVAALFPPGIKEHCAGSKAIVISQYRTDQTKLMMELGRTLICNVNEIDTLLTPSTYSEFKRMLDATKDDIVLPYGKATTPMLRRTVFIGSTNKTQLFADPTANRRFWLLHARRLNFQHNIDLMQLWAEAYHYYKQGEHWWISDNSILRMQEVDNRQAMNTMADDIIDALNNTFDHTQPLEQWQPYTFPRICTLLGITAKPRSDEHRRTKQAIVHWLQDVTADPVIKEPKAHGTAWYCKMPPLRVEVQ